MRNERAYWNSKKGKRVRLVFPDGSDSAKQLNGRTGIAHGCNRGDCGPNDPYVYVKIDTKPDGTATGWFFRHTPASCLELIKERTRNEQAG